MAAPTDEKIATKNLLCKYSYDGVLKKGEISFTEKESKTKKVTPQTISIPSVCEVVKRTKENFDSLIYECDSNHQFSPLALHLGGKNVSSQKNDVVIHSWPTGTLFLWEKISDLKTKKPNVEAISPIMTFQNVKISESVDYIPEEYRVIIKGIICSVLKVHMDKRFLDLHPRNLSTDNFVLDGGTWKITGIRSKPLSLDKKEREKELMADIEALAIFIERDILESETPPPDMEQLLNTMKAWTCGDENFLAYHYATMTYGERHAFVMGVYDNYDSISSQSYQPFSPFDHFVEALHQVPSKLNWISSVFGTPTPQKHKVFCWVKHCFDEDRSKMVANKVGCLGRRGEPKPIAKKKSSGRKYDDTDPNGDTLVSKWNAIKCGRNIAEHVHEFIDVVFDLLVEDAVVSAVFWDLMIEVQHALHRKKILRNVVFWMERDFPNCLDL